MKPYAFYNENDPFAAAWLRELIKEGLITDGVVDERSICDVQPEDLRGFTRVHLFAGIAGWEVALNLAGWGDRPVLTGSCPCQPFSVAGKRKGTADSRHLWPDMHRLVTKCHPATVFGEQVASKDGRVWLAGVRADLEALGYAVGAADLCAAGVSAPHIRQRLYWLADAKRDSRDERRLADQPGESTGEASARPRNEFGRRSVPGGLANNNSGQCGRFTDREGCEHDRQTSGRQQSNSIVEPSRTVGSGLANGAGARSLTTQQEPEGEARDETWLRRSECGRGSGSGLADKQADGRQQECTDGRGVTEGSGAQGRPTGLGLRSASGRTGDGDIEGSQGRGEHAGEHANQRTPWSASVFIPCLDGKYRRVPANEAGEPEPSLFPLVDGFPSRVGILRGAGNAIVPQVAAEFIRAYLDTRPFFAP